MLLKYLLKGRGKPILKNLRNVSILSSLQTSSVLVSANRDVYTNLALEHWLYNNLRFNEDNKLVDVPVRKYPVVLIWTDEPCLVIGRHQNPWIEANLGIINKVGIKLARRHSGGGCVYHDENNLNISIIGDRKVFDDRQGNLKFLANVLKENYNLDCEPTKRNDLIYSERGLKISGSAAKLGRFNSYHHFTLLVNTDKDLLDAAIRQKQQDFIRTHSSLSTRAKVMNLKEVKPDLEVDKIITDLSNAYNKLYPTNSISRIISERGSASKGDESEFKKLSEYRDELISWNWLYGMTPRFELEKSFQIVEDGKEKPINIYVRIDKGLFETIRIDGDLSTGSPNEMFSYMIGTRFTYQDAMINLTKLLKVDSPISKEANVSVGIETLFITFLLQMVHESNF